MTAQQLDLTFAEFSYTAPDQLSSSIEIQKREGVMPNATAEEERITPITFHTARLRLKSFDIDPIQVGHRARTLNAERLEALTQSISNIGLRPPITVHIIRGRRGSATCDRTLSSRSSQKARNGVDLTEAIPLTETIPNRDAIVDGSIELIPLLADAVLQLEDIPKQQLIEGLLKYCGYNEYSARVGQR